jgi:hypothetical protein
VRSGSGRMSLGKNACGGEEKNRRAKRQHSPDGEHAGSVAGHDRRAPSAIDCRRAHRIEAGS